MVKNRNALLIFSKQGQQYELNKDKWTIYANFNQIYSNTYEEMEEASIAFKLDDSVWMDSIENQCVEKHASG